jgi:hypothetical protein
MARNFARRKTEIDDNIKVNLREINCEGWEVDWTGSESCQILVVLNFWVILPESWNKYHCNQSRISSKDSDSERPTSP